VPDSIASQPTTALKDSASTGGMVVPPPTTIIIFGASGDLTQQAVSALATSLAAQEAMYGTTADHRALATTCAWSGEPQRQPLDQAVSAILNATFGEGPHGHPAPAL